MKLNMPEPPRTEENLIPLINIVFLILIFFLIASTISPFADRQIKLAETTMSEANGQSSPRILIMKSSGEHYVGTDQLIGNQLDSQFADWSKDQSQPITIVADGKTKADALVATVSQARSAGIKDIKLLTRQVR